jgi:GTPase SAR1 family protein
MSSINPHAPPLPPSLPPPSSSFVLQGATGNHDISEEVFDMFDQIHDINARGMYRDTFPDLKEALHVVWKKKGVWKKGERAKLWKQWQTAGNTNEREQTLGNAIMCLKYFNKVFDDDFELSHDDFIRVRNPTLIMTKTKGVHNGEEFQLVDVGGQLHFQQEWDSAIGQFGQDCAVVYVVSLGDYDRVDQSGTHRFQSCLETWDKLLSTKVVEGVPIILVLNKEDSFYKKLETIPLNTCPLLKHSKPKAKGEDNEEFHSRCVADVLELFDKAYQGKPHGEHFCYNLPSHTTCATDQKLVTELLEKLIGGTEQ